MAYTPPTISTIPNYWLNGKLVVPGSPDDPANPSYRGPASLPAAPPQNTWGPGGFQMPSGFDLAQYTGAPRRPPGTLAGGNSAASAGSFPVEKQAAIPSLSGAITNSDHSPSVYGRFVEGDKNGESDAEWLAHGGASVLGSLNAGGTNQISQALGLGKATDTMDRLFGIQSKRKDATDIWGTAAQNAAMADKYDWAGYGQATGLKDAWQKAVNDTSAQGKKDLHFQVASDDVNNDGNLSLGEFVQWWAMNTPEGKAAMKNGDIAPVTAGMSGKVPTFEELQAARAGQGGAPAAPLPINDPRPSGVPIQQGQSPTALASATPDMSGIDPEQLKKLLAAYA